MTSYILKGEDRSRNAFEVKKRAGVQKTIKGTTRDKETAERWADSEEHRSYMTVPVMEMQETTSYEFNAK
jgi:hypothetical protein